MGWFSRLSNNFKQAVAKDISKRHVFYSFGVLASLTLVFSLLLSPLLTEQAKAATSYTAGKTTVGTTTYYGQQNVLSASQVKTGSVGGTLNSLSVYVGTVHASPLNHMQVALYADNGANAPGNKLAQSSAKVLVANSWNSFSMPTSTVAAATNYWLVFNVDGSSTRISIASVTGGRSVWTYPVSYGTWPASYGSANLSEAKQYSMYMTYSSGTAPADTTAPSIPSNLAASAASSSQLNLSWAASTDSGGSGLAGYNVYRGTSATTITTKLNSSLVTSTSFNNTGLAANTAYYYQVEAVDGASNISSKSGTASTTTQSNPTPPPTSGCGLPVTPGTSTQTITVNGVQRTYLRVIPASVTSNTPVPVIMGFHGGNDTAERANGYMGLTDSQPVVYIYPQAGPFSDAWAGWNVDPAGLDFPYVDVALTDIKSKNCVDSTRVFAAGMSNGAFFVNSLLCLRPDSFKAAASVAGGGPQYNCSKPRAFMGVHGTADTPVPYSTGVQSRDYWRAANQYANATPVPYNSPATPCVSYPDTINPVVWCSHDGGHLWPTWAGATIRSFFLSL